MCKNLFLLVVFHLFAQNIFSQTCDLEIYSSQSEKFFLHINGVKRAQEAQTQYELFHLPVGFYEALVTFPESKDTIIKTLGLSANTKTTYAVVHKPKKNRYKLKYKSQQAFYTNHNTGNTTKQNNKLTPAQPNPNCTDIVADWNEIRRLQLYLNELQFDEEKLEVLRRELNLGCYYSFHLMSFFSYIKTDHFKLEAAKFFVEKTYDLENLKLYAPSFKSNQFRSDYLAYIKSYL